MDTVLYTTTSKHYTLIPKSAVEYVEGDTTEIVGIGNGYRIVTEKAANGSTTLYTIPKD